MWIKKSLITSAILCVLLSACGGGSDEEPQPQADPQNDGQTPPPAQNVRPEDQSSESPASAPLPTATTPSASAPSPPASMPAPPASTPVPSAPTPAPAASTPAPAASTPPKPSSPGVPGNTGVAAPIPNATTGANAVYDLIVSERNKCGFAPIQRHAQLDLAARNHALWMLKNRSSEHDEIADTPGFTGVKGWDRAAHVGYEEWGFAEILSYQNRFNSTELLNWEVEGIVRMRNLLAAPYHMTGAFGGYPDIGISILLSAANPLADVNQTSTAVSLVVDLSAPKQQDRKISYLSTDTIATYPCEGTTGTLTKLTNEVPNPVPGRDLGRYPIGQPVMVVAGKRKTLTLELATMKDASGQNIALLSTLNKASDKNDRLDEDTAFLMPDKPLLPNSKYTVHVKGTSGSTPFDSTFSFTTGN
jgi:uncharacterized protein YkwD